MTVQSNVVDVYIKEPEKDDILKNRELVYVFKCVRCGETFESRITDKWKCDKCRKEIVKERRKKETEKKREIERKVLTKCQKSLIKAQKGMNDDFKSGIVTALDIIDSCMEGGTE